MGEGMNVDPSISEGYVELVVPHLPRYRVSPLILNGYKQAGLSEEIRNTGTHVLEAGDVHLLGLQFNRFFAMGSCIGEGLLLLQLLFSP